MSRKYQFTIQVEHDEHAAVWYVHSSDVPGLNAEARSLDELVAVVADLAPELIEHNLNTDRTASEVQPDITLCVQHVMKAARARAA